MRPMHSQFIYHATTIIHTFYARKFSPIYISFKTLFRKYAENLRVDRKTRIYLTGITRIDDC
jgi:hypothetical protein